MRRDRLSLRRIDIGFERGIRLGRDLLGALRQDELGVGLHLMHAGKQCPVVSAGTRMRDVIYEMSSKGLGMTCVVDGEDEVLLGIITDGDLRRRMERGGEILDLRAADVMTRNPVTIPRSMLAAAALNIMEQRKITSLVVVESSEPPRIAGVLQIHDLWRMEMF